MITSKIDFTHPDEQGIYIDHFVNYVEANIERQIQFRIMDNFFSDDFDMSPIKIEIPCVTNHRSLIKSTMFALDLSYSAIGWKSITHEIADEKFSTDFVLTITLN